MPKKSKFKMSYHEMFRQDKLDDAIFFYTAAYMKALPAATLMHVAESFCNEFDLIFEEDVDSSQFTTSFYRTLHRYRDLRRKKLGKNLENDK